MMEEESIDKWFLREFYRLKEHISNRDGICQCGTEAFIAQSNSPEQMRMFLLVSVFIDQIMQTTFRDVYETFRMAFRYPKLYQCQTYEMASPSWFIHGFRDHPKRMDWSPLEPMVNTLVGGLYDWFRNDLKDEEMVKRFVQCSNAAVKRNFSGDGAARFLSALGKVNEEYAA